MKAFIVTDNDHFVIGYALVDGGWDAATQRSQAKALGMHYHPDPPSCEYTSLIARRMPLLDGHEIFLLNGHTFIEVADEHLHPRIMPALKKLGLAWKEYDEYNEKDVWRFATSSEERR